MLEKLRGFTIVEICVTIAIMGIILSIGIYSWSSYVSMSEDKARLASTEQWISAFELYKSRFFVYPIMPTGSATYVVACLGDVNSFPTASGSSTGGNRCGQFKTTGTGTSASTSSSMINNIKKVSKIYKNPHEESGKTIYENTLVGPLVHISRSGTTGTVTLTARFVTLLKSSCASHNLQTATPGSLPNINALKPATGSGSSVNVCYAERQFTYNL